MQRGLNEQIGGWDGRAFLILVLSLIVGVSRDLYLLIRFSTEVGVDGYYYVIQINNLLSEGHFYFPTNTPITLYFLAGISYVTDNTILAIKLGSIILHVLLCLGIFALIKNITQKIWLGVFGSVLAILSSLHLYMIAEFINQLCAMTFLIWSGWCAVIALQKKSKLWLAVGLGLFILALLSHRSAPFITLMIIAPMILLHFVILPESVKSAYKIFALLFIIIVWLMPFIAAVQPFVQLPVWLKSEVLISPRVPIARVAFVEDIILLVAAPTMLFLLIRFRARFQNDFINCFFGSIATISLLITLNPFLNHNTGLLGLVGRLSSFTYLQVAFLVPGLIWLLDGYASRKVALLIAALVLILMIFSLAMPLPAGLRPEYLAERSELVRQLPMHFQQPGSSSIIIAPHGEEFIVTAVLGVPSQQRLPEGSKYKSVWWLLHKVNSRQLLELSDVVMTDGNNSSTVLIKDNDLQHKMETLTGIERRQLFAANPHLRQSFYKNSETN